MGWLHVAIGLVACFLLYGSEKPIAFWVAVVATAGTLWSFGIMHNFATESAKMKTRLQRGVFRPYGKRREYCSKLARGR